MKTTLHLFLKRKFIEYKQFFISYHDQQMHNYFTNYHTPTCFDKSYIGQTGRSIKIWDTSNIDD